MTRRARGTSTARGYSVMIGRATRERSARSTARSASGHATAGMHTGDLATGRRWLWRRFQTRRPWLSWEPQAMAHKAERRRSGTLMARRRPSSSPSAIGRWVVEDWPYRGRHDSNTVGLPKLACREGDGANGCLLHERNSSAGETIQIVTMPAMDGCMYSPSRRNEIDPRKLSSARLELTRFDGSAEKLVNGAESLRIGRRTAGILEDGQARRSSRDDRVLSRADRHLQDSPATGSSSTSSR